MSEKLTGGPDWTRHVKGNTVHCALGVHNYRHMSCKYEESLKFGNTTGWTKFCQLTDQRVVMLVSIQYATAT